MRPRVYLSPRVATAISSWAREQLDAAVPAGVYVTVGNADGLNYADVYIPGGPEARVFSTNLDALVDLIVERLRVILPAHSS